MNQSISHVRIFANRELPTGSGQGLTHEQIKEKLDTALSSVFSEDGKKTVLFYLTEDYSLTLDRASKDPGKLEESLTNLLGEIGWTVVKCRILREIYGPSLEVDSVSAGTASLSDAFGFVRLLRSVVGASLVHF